MAKIIHSNAHLVQYSYNELIKRFDMIVFNHHNVLEICPIPHYSDLYF